MQNNPANPQKFSHECCKRKSAISTAYFISMVLLEIIILHFIILFN
jgi:hypothetical protein